MKEIESMSDLQNCIYRIRGQQVMLDSELARLYGVPTKRLNEQVRRNLRRFPPDFMFQLSLFELDFLRSQFATFKNPQDGRRRYTKYRPLVFTEHGVAMLSSVLKSDKAIQVNIAIVRAFIKLRRAHSGSRAVSQRVEKLEGKVNLHDTDIRLLREEVRGLKSPTSPSPKITGFKKD